MVKLVYIIYGELSEPASSFSDRVLRGLVPRLLGQDPSRLKISMTAMNPPLFSVIPYRRKRIALISLWIGEGVGQTVEGWSRLVAGAWGGGCFGYRVEESRPVAYKRSWPDFTRTPGLGLLTLFRPRRGIAHEEFIRRWHHGHTPLALRIHPLWNYVRNVVRECIIPGSPSFAGIVEEQCRAVEEILKPTRFFGGLLPMLPNMIRIALDIRKWMDFRSIENHLVHEYWIRDITHAPESPFDL